MFLKYPSVAHVSSALRNADRSKFTFTDVELNRSTLTNVEQTASRLKTIWTYPTVELAVNETKDFSEN